MKSASRVGRFLAGADDLQRWATLVALVALNTLPSRAQHIAAEALPASADEHFVALDDFVITDSNSLKTTLPVRPVAGVYGFDTAYQDIPRSITQINPQQFEQDIIASYSDFVRYSPSVNQSTGQISNYGSPTMRGSKSDAYQNGVRMLTRQQNNRPFTLNAYEGADIIAGPAPVIYGPSERTSGYVNYVTKRPYFDRQHTAINIRVGKLYGDGTGFRENENWQIDTGGPIGDGRLAYRVSYQGENVDAYHDRVGNRFHDVYGTLAWIPSGDLTLDWNFEYGTFDWRVNNGLNRVTNALVRDGTYLAGPATPVIQGAFSGTATGYYSPVWVPGSGFDGTSFIRRTRNADGSFSAGEVLAGAPTAAQAGLVVGYVLDPALVRETRISDTAALNAPGHRSNTDAFNTQVRIKKTFGPDFTLLNNTLYQYYHTDTASNGGFYNWIRAGTIENRTEALLERDFDLAGLAVRLQGNTGFSYRFEEIRNYKDAQRNGYGPTGDWYDLTADPESFTRNAFFGAQVYPFSGTVNTPVLTRYGHLRGFYPYLTVPESPGNAVSPGGSDPTQPWLSSTSNHTRTSSASVYTQQSFRIAERVIVDLGVRATHVASKIENPLALNEANAAIRDEYDDWLPGYSASVSYRPVSWIATYATYAYVVAQNGMTTGSPTWATVGGVPNQLDPAAFDSLSVLREVGAKFELIPTKLVGGLSVYRQVRDLTLTAVPGSDPIQARGEYQGIEVNLRYQPVTSFHAGINYTYIEGQSLNQTISAPNPIVADNATNIIGSRSLGRGDWRVTNLPRNNLTFYGSLLLTESFGVRTDLWLRDSAYANNDGSVTVPSQYQINVGVFYNRPSWSAAIDIQNITNERLFSGGSTLLEPLTVQGRIGYRF